MYSRDDHLAPSSAVEAHAAEAKMKKIDVQLEGSGHIGHMRKDGERYWHVVQKVWETVSGVASRI